MAEIPDVKQTFHKTERLNVEGELTCEVTVVIRDKNGKMLIRGERATLGPMTKRDHKRTDKMRARGTEFRGAIDDILYEAGDSHTLWDDVLEASKAPSEKADGKE